MITRILADAVLLLHLGFILFVVAGGFLVLRWPKLAWAHVPVFLWGVAIEFIGFVCPLTYLENHLRRAGTQKGYETSFVEQYLLPLIYPELLFPGGFPRSGFIAIGAIVLGLNLAIYYHLWRRHKRRRLAK